MALTVKHSTVVAKANDPAYDVSANAWNDNHTLVGTLDTAQITNGAVTLEKAASDLQGYIIAMAAAL